jgi:hypothetical protein
MMKKVITEKLTAKKIIIGKILMMSFILGVLGCSSVPQKNLTTENGIIAAHFTIHPYDVSRFKKTGLDTDQIIRILIISTASHLTTDDVIKIHKEGKAFEEIAAEVGISKELLDKRTEAVKKEISEMLK